METETKSPTKAISEMERWRNDLHEQFLHDDIVCAEANMHKSQEDFQEYGETFPGFYAWHLQWSFDYFRSCLDEHESFTKCRRS